MPISGVSHETHGMILGILGITTFGLTLPATRYVIEYLDPIFIGTGRAVLAALVAGLILIVKRTPLPNRRQFMLLTVASFGVVIGFPIFTALAMETVPASHGGVVLGLLPLLTAIIGAFINNERPSLGFWIAGIVGSACVISFTLLTGTGSLVIGDWYLLGAAITGSLGYAFSGWISRELGGWQVICWCLVMTCPFIIVPAWLTAPQTVINFPVSVWIGFLYLALISQLAGFFLWNKGLALGGIARVSQAQLLQPFVTILASAILVGEHLNATTIIFALLVGTCVFIGKRMPIKTKISR